jgi:thioredoxin 1
MLQTNLQHVQSEEEFRQTIKDNENVMICCGRMGPMCIPVYEVMEDIRDEYKHIAFRDMEFDSAHSHVIRNRPVCNNFRGIPFTFYFKNGQVVKATSSIQTKDQVTEILDAHFAGVEAK